MPSVWPAFLYSVDATTTASVVGPDSPAGAVTSVGASAAVPAMPWPQLIVIAIVVLLIWWLWHDRRRRDAKVARLVEEARREGRTEAAESGVLRQAVSAGAAAFVLALALAVGGGGAAHAATQPDPGDGSVSVKVDIRPATTAPTPLPTPAGSGGALAATGSSDGMLIALAVTGVTLGAAVLVRSRRRRNAG